MKKIKLSVYNNPKHPHWNVDILVPSKEHKAYPYSRNKQTLNQLKRFGSTSFQTLSNVIKQQRLEVERWGKATKQYKTVWTLDEELILVRLGIRGGWRKIWSYGYPYGKSDRNSDSFWL